MTTKLVFSGKDYSDERTRVGVEFPVADASNFDQLVTDAATLLAAFQGVSSNALSGQRMTTLNVEPGPKATTKSEQREQKWLVRYSDTVNPIGDGSFEIPMANTALLDTNGKDLDVSQGAGATLVTQIEALCVSRLGNPISVQSVKYVGRNL